jgi:RsiW-degrading membrane proteinase PrsW (M82 family)
MEEQPAGKKWQIIVTLVISALGILYFIGQALVLGMALLLSLFQPQTGFSQNLPLGIVLWFSVLSAVLLLPILLISYFQLRGHSLPHWLDTSRPVFSKISNWIIIIWPVVVAIGWVISKQPEIAAYLIGPVNVLTAGIPVLWIYHKAQYKLDGGPQIRKWRIFGFSLTVMPVIVIIAELIAIIVLALLVLLYFQVINPQFGQDVMQILDLLRENGENLDAIMQDLEPYLRQPLVIFSAFSVVAGIIPVIEELIKPLALWSLAGRKLSPQEGFVGGLLCGAGFALMENVLYFANVMTSGDWIVMAVGRAGTGILHMLASGLVGLGLARAWRDRKWKSLVFSTLGAIVLHGLWNALALASGFLPLILEIEETTIWQDILFNAPLILLMVLSAVGICVINRKLRKQAGEKDEGTLPLSEQQESI